MTTPDPALRATLDEAISLKYEISDLEERLGDAKSYYLTLTQETLPDAFDEAGLAELTIASIGNRPPLQAKLVPFYRAAIPASWSAEQRQAAFETLKDEGAEDLIVTTVTVTFGKGDYDAALAFYRRAVEAGFSASMGGAVHHMTLTAWLKDQIENHHHVPPLEKIGATVGRKVNIKETKG